MGHDREATGKTGAPSFGGWYGIDFRNQTLLQRQTQRVLLVLWMRDGLSGSGFEWLTLSQTGTRCALHTLGYVD